MQNSSTIGFIGAGNMAYALISGLINNDFPAENIAVSDLSSELLSQRKTEFNLKVFTDNTDLVNNCDIIVLAVKPQVLFDVCDQIKNDISDKHLIISIAAGIRSHDINRWLGKGRAIVRTMPNTPALLGKGITGMFANEEVSDEQKTNSEDIINAVGSSIWVESEDMVDAVTAVSGSGPAYFFLMIESMTKAGMALGLDEESANKLSIETALGAAMMAKNSSDNVHELRAKVTSPNGTTQAAIESFQDQDFEVIVSHALRAAYDRASELAQELGDK